MEKPLSPCLSYRQKNSIRPWQKTLAHHMFVSSILFTDASYVIM